MNEEEIEIKLPTVKIKYWKIDDDLDQARKVESALINLIHSPKYLNMLGEIVNKAKEELNNKRSEDSLDKFPH